jgi:hypothetical protein
MFEASLFFNSRLPKVFAGYDRDKIRFPVEYPTACLPQAWAAGAPMLGIRTLLLEPRGDVLTSASEPVLPVWMGTLTVENIPGRWGRQRVVAKGDDSKVFSTKQIFEEGLSRRSEFEKEKLAA